MLDLDKTVALDALDTTGDDVTRLVKAYPEWIRFITHGYVAVLALAVATDDLPVDGAIAAAACAIIRAMEAMEKAGVTDESSSTP